MKSIELDVQYYHLTRKAGNIVLIRDCTTAIEVADTHENLDLSRNAVIDTDGIEFEGHSTRCPDRFFDPPPKLLQMNMARNNVDVGINNRDEGFLKIFIFNYTGCLEQGSVGRSFVAFFYLVRSHVCLCVFRLFY